MTLYTLLRISDPFAFQGEIYLSYTEALLEGLQALLLAGEGLEILIGQPHYKKLT